MKQSIIIELPIKVSANKIYAGVHWSERKKIKDLFLWGLLGIKKELKKVGKCKLTFNFQFKSNPLDDSNCFFMVKIIEDCLVHYKILEDDKYDIVRGITVTSNKGDRDIVELIIEEVEAND